MIDSVKIKEKVKQRYSKVALTNDSCCGTLTNLQDSGGYCSGMFPVPPSGIGASTLYINASNDPAAKLYTFPITANISSLAPINNSRGEIYNDSRSDTTISTNLILVITPYSFDVQIKNFVAMWMTPLGGVSSVVAGVGAVVVPLFLYFHRKKQKQQTEEEKK